jgi:hypothetical protein
MPLSTALGHPETDARVVVLGCERRSVGEHIGREVRAEVAVARASAKDRPPAMPVRIDQARHRDHPGAIDDLSAIARQPGADIRDVLTVDPQIADDEFTVVVVQRQQKGSTDQI